MGERKRGKEEEPVFILLNTSCRPLFPKCVNMSKCQTFHCPGFDYSREFSSSRSCPYIASMSRTPKGSPGLRFQPSKSCRFCQKNLTCLGTKVPRVYLFDAVRNFTRRYRARDYSVGRCCVFAWLYLNVSSQAFKKRRAFQRQLPHLCEDPGQNLWHV